VSIGLAATLCVLLAVALNGGYRPVVRYFSEVDAWRLLRGISLGVLLWVGYTFVLQVNIRVFVPRSVPVLYWLLSIVLLVGGRFAIKKLLSSARNDTLPRVLIYGAGAAGARAAAMMKVSLTRRVVGFLDDNASMQARQIAGLTVYPPARALELVQQLGVDEIVLAVPSATDRDRQRMVEGLVGSGATLTTVPSFHALLSGRATIDAVEKIDIDGLVGRRSVAADDALIERTLASRSVLVTGAGGSIGSELCRLVAASGARKLVLYEANEFALYSIDQDLSSSGRVVPVLGSVTDAATFEAAIREHAVDVIFHAAAHKHVPLLEENVLEAIRNNVVGAKVVADVAVKTGVKQTVLISSDKAVRPSNVMGATKRWAELIFHAARSSGSGGFCAVRFGNVLGSNGSVIPLFQKQIAQGGPLTITDPYMTRYFMSIREAAELIVQAAGLSEGGDTFLLDMGEPVTIGDLAKNLIHLSGLSVRDAANPAGDIEIKVVGRRPGEKQHEELYYDADRARPTAHPKISRAPGSPFLPNLEEKLNQLLHAVGQRDEGNARHVLFQVVHESGEHTA
jgi:FlaA1/EpsC-like NDP-sugar epimerase